MIKIKKNKNIEKIIKMLRESEFLKRKIQQQQLK